MIQLGGVKATFCQDEGILLPKVSRWKWEENRDILSKMSGSGVDLTLLIHGWTALGRPHSARQRRSCET